MRVGKDGFHEGCWRMGAWMLLLVIIAPDRCLGLGYRSGFPLLSCDNMLPDELQDDAEESWVLPGPGESLPMSSDIPPSALAATTTTQGNALLSPKPTDWRATTESDEMAAAALEDGQESERAATELHISNRPSPFSLQASNSSVKRYDEVEVSVIGNDVEAFMIQARSPEEGRGRGKVIRIGTFTKFDMETTKPLVCDEHKPINTLTNRNPKPKSNLTFTWMPPQSDTPTEVIFVATFIAGGEVWTNVKTEVQIKDFPFGFKPCGQTKSCFRAISDKKDVCTPHSCEYIVSYVRSPDNRTVDVAMGGEGGNRTYLAIGFSKSSNESRKDITLIACIMDGNVIEFRKFYIADLDDPDLVEDTHILENVRSAVEDNMMWCGFSHPIKSPADNQVDFTIPVYQIYLWGKVNETTLVPFIPPANRIVVTGKPVFLGVFLNTTRIMSGSESGSSFSTSLLLVASIMALLLGGSPTHL